MPQSDRKSTLKVLHMGHYEIDKMNLRASETVYWPGIMEDIKDTYHQCHICAKFARTQQKEMLQSVETPQTRWEQLGLDIFSLKGIHYLLTVDYFSQFPVVRKLQSPFTECNKNSERDLHNSRCPQMYSLGWWHTIHITRVEGLYQKLAN